MSQANQRIATEAAQRKDATTTTTSRPSVHHVLGDSFLAANSSTKNLGDSLPGYAMRSVSSPPLGSRVTNGGVLRRAGREWDGMGMH